MKPSLFFLLMTTLMLKACASDDVPSDQDEIVDRPTDQVSQTMDMDTMASVDFDVGSGPDQGTGPDTSEASFKVRGTLGQIYVWNAPIEEELDQPAHMGRELMPAGD